MAKAADLSAASELCPERRKVMKEERSSFGASGTPTCVLNAALTSLVHCGALSGFEAKGGAGLVLVGAAEVQVEAGGGRLEDIAEAQHPLEGEVKPSLRRELESRVCTA